MRPAEAIRRLIAGGGFPSLEPRTIAPRGALARVVSVVPVVQTSDLLPMHQIQTIRNGPPGFQKQRARSIGCGRAHVGRSADRDNPLDGRPGSAGERHPVPARSVASGKRTGSSLIGTDSSSSRAIRISSPSCATSSGSMSKGAQDRQQQRTS
jgi:hypothetical protein